MSDELAILKAELKTVDEKVLWFKNALTRTEMERIDLVKRIAALSAPVAVELVINEEWQTVLDELQHGTGHVFITGGAGVGKSTLVEHFLKICDRRVAVLAPTGVAALRVNGQTIHSFFRFGAHALEKDDIRMANGKDLYKYEALEILVLDEASMIRADLMDAIDMFLRKNRRQKSTPFGGVRIVLVGDLFQLPPVSKERDEKKWLEQTYGTDMPFFFHANCWRETPIKTFNLTTIFRQSDPVFTGALNAIRNGTATKEHLGLINSRVNSRFTPPNDELWITLTTTNDAAKQMNQKMLDLIQSPSKTFEAAVIGEFDLKNAPTEEFLELKVGAAVMFVRNDADHRWVNGTIGKVVSIEPLQVEVNDEPQFVEAEMWEQIVYEHDPVKNKLAKIVKGKFNQIPLKLAAAITIHKSQGLSLDRVHIDLGWGAFAAGQAYVALSRCRTLQGMVLRKPLAEKDLITSNEVIKFMNNDPIARPVTITQGALL